MKDTQVDTSIPQPSCSMHDCLGNPSTLPPKTEDTLLGVQFCSPSLKESEQNLHFYWLNHHSYWWKELP